MYEYKAKLVRVIDGDTISLDVDLGFYTSRTETFRLYGVDTKELHDKIPEGKVLAIQAREYVKNQLADKPLIVKTLKDKEDKYGRMLALVFIEGDDESLNNKLVTLGLAVPYYL